MLFWKPQQPGDPTPTVWSTDFDNVNTFAFPQALRTLSTSEFRKAYDQAKAPEFQHQLMEAVCEVIAAYCKVHDINYSYCKDFFQRLQNEAFRVKDELLTEVPAAAQRLWTSPLPLSSQHGKALCNIINEAIRADAPGGMRHLATLVRGINTLCVIRRPSGAVNFPSNGICWRGGGLSDEHQTFYVPGKVYRVPGFLATSFSQDKAEEFLYRAHVLAGHPAIKWVVHLDARGATQHKYRCRHVDLCLCQVLYEVACTSGCPLSPVTDLLRVYMSFH